MFIIRPRPVQRTQPLPAGFSCMFCAHLAVRGGDHVDVVADQLEREAPVHEGEASLRRQRHRHRRRLRRRPLNRPDIRE